MILELYPLILELSVKNFENSTEIEHKFETFFYEDFNSNNFIDRAILNGNYYLEIRILFLFI